MELEIEEIVSEQKDIIIPKTSVEKKHTSPFIMITDLLPEVWGGHLVIVKDVFPGERIKYQNDLDIVTTEIKVIGINPISITIFEGIKHITKGVPKIVSKMEITSHFSEKKLNKLFSVINTTKINFGENEANEVAEFKLKDTGDMTVSSTIELTAYNLRQFMKLLLVYTMIEIE